MEDYLTFKSKEAFRFWLENNARTIKGVYLFFRKNETLTYQEALDEALCFGWIDSTIKSLDNGGHIRYFCERRKNSKWSEKNKKTVEALIQSGRMTELGLEKINEAKENGMWDRGDTPNPSEEDYLQFESLLSSSPLALANYRQFSSSIRRTYLLYYMDAKGENTKAKRLNKIIERLEQNLKPM